MFNIRLKEKIEDLELEIEMLKNHMEHFENRPLIEYSEIFNRRVFLEKYEKENQTYYYLKKQGSLFERGKVLTPDFTNELELILHLMKNFEEVKKEVENE